MPIVGKRVLQPCDFHLLYSVLSVLNKSPVPPNQIGEQANHDGEEADQHENRGQDQRLNMAGAVAHCIKIKESQRKNKT